MDLRKSGQPSHFCQDPPYPVSEKKRRGGTVSDFAVNAQNVFRTRYPFALDRDDRQPNRRVRTRRTDSCRQLYDAIPAHCQHPGERRRGLSCPAAVLLLFRQTRKTGTAALIALLAGVILTNLILKNAVARERPFSDPTSVYYTCWLETGSMAASGYSFPSGHTTAAMNDDRPKPRRAKDFEM